MVNTTQQKNKTTKPIKTNDSVQMPTDKKLYNTLAMQETYDYSRQSSRQGKQHLIINPEVELKLPSQQQPS